MYQYRTCLHQKMMMACVAILLMSQASAETIDQQKSKAQIQIYPRLPIPSQGQFSEVSGKLNAHSENSYKVDVILDARKIRFTGPEWLNRTAQSEDFLAVDAFPSIRFASQPFNKELLLKGGELSGELNLRGHQRMAAFSILPATCSEPGHGCPLIVRGKINRRDFGMQTHRISVKDKVDFEFTIFFEPKPL